ncbi:MAG: hypothetical protein QOF61_1330 [Acidobacteriota bacterium]|nr:hypothetical protein [Acidobacteriota bacterium]
MRRVTSLLRVVLLLAGSVSLVPRLSEATATTAASPQRSLPDLGVRSTLVAGEHEIEALIWNRGMSASGACVATLYLYAADGTQLGSYDEPIKSLLPNSGATIRFSTGGRSLARVRYQVFADSHQQVSEVNETNNRSTVQIAPSSWGDIPPRKEEPPKESDKANSGAKKASEIDLAVKAVSFTSIENTTYVVCAVENISGQMSVAGRKMKFERLAKVGAHIFNLKFAEKVVPYLEASEVFEWKVKPPQKEPGAVEYVWKCSLTPADAGPQNDARSFTQKVNKID